MSLTDGQQALIRRIVEMDDPPNIVLPGGPSKGLPRFVIQASGGSQQTFGVDGHVESNPEITVRVETDGDKYATDNDDLVAALVARFPLGYANAFDGVTIMTPPLPRPPLPVADGVYSVPVTIMGRYSF